MVNRSAGTIMQFAHNEVDGRLTPALIADPGSPWQMLIGPSGQLAYVSQETTNTVNIFSIGSDGTLRPYSSATTGQRPGGIGLAP